MFCRQLYKTNDKKSGDQIRKILYLGKSAFQKWKSTKIERVGTTSFFWIWQSVINWIIRNFAARKNPVGDYFRITFEKRNSGVPRVLKISPREFFSFNLCLFRCSNSLKNFFWKGRMLKCFECNKTKKKLNPHWWGLEIMGISMLTRSEAIIKAPPMHKLDPCRKRAPNRLARGMVGCVFLLLSWFHHSIYLFPFILPTKS
jgi:hypothetical protein